VELISLSNGGESIPLSKLEKSEGWKRNKDQKLTTDGEQPTYLVYEGKFFGGVNFTFNALSKESSIEVCWKDTGECRIREANPAGKIVYKDGQQIPIISHLPAMICLSGFLSCILILGFIIFPDKWIKKLKMMACSFTLASFQVWFRDTTEMFGKVIILILITSFFATFCLFVLPFIMQDRTPLATETESKTEKPNIIMIIVDALSAEDMSLYGYSLPTTPNLEKITKTWTIYTNAISPVTCSIGYLPSILTGRYFYHSTYPNYRIGEIVFQNPNWVDISLLLKKDGYDTWERGYLTPGFLHLGYGFNHFGSDVSSSFMHKYWLQPEGNVIKSPHFPYKPLYLAKLFPAGPTRSSMTLSKLRAILISHQFKEPWFLYFHYGGAHGPFYYSPGTLGTFLPTEEGLIDKYEIRKYYGKYDIKNQDMVDKLRLRYDEAVLQQDRYLAALISTLKKVGLYDSSMIIITADHGQNFSNGYSSHCTLLLSYPEVHVPLLIKYPYQTNGNREDNLVSTIDLTPTFLQVAGIAYDPKWFDGKTLFEASQFPQDRIVFSKPIHSSTIAAINYKWKLTLRKGKLFLFDYHSDPLENVNLFEQYRNDPEIIALENSIDQYVAKIKLMNEGGIP
jgi:arylsulfatase A-like enzyme